jgi:hypothetical protein
MVEASADAIAAPACASAAAQRETVPVMQYGIDFPAHMDRRLQGSWQTADSAMQIFGGQGV